MRKFTINSGEDVKQARNEMGMSINDLRDALRLSEANGGSTIRKWERGKAQITGPAAVAIELMLEQFWEDQNDYN